MATETKRLVVKESFIGNVDGADVAFRAGDTIESTHKAVKKWPTFFKEPGSPTHSPDNVTPTAPAKEGAS